MALIFTGFSARLIFLQVTKHDEYTAIAARKHSITIPIPARRGLIMDRTGEILAANMPVRSVSADGSLIKDPAKLAAIASPFLDIPEDKLAEILTKEIVNWKEKNRKFKSLVPVLAEEKALALQEAMNAKGQRGLFFEPDTVRTYPNGALASHLVGYVRQKDDKDETIVGKDGVEGKLENLLRGTDGSRLIERDRVGREIVIYRGQDTPAKDGHDVKLTIDMGIQAILESELAAAYKEYQPINAIGIILRPKTGEILAMANCPTFDLNNINEAKPENMRNHAIKDMVEPGSTFKIVVASAALNEKVITERTQIFCENGRFAYRKSVLRDHEPYGDLTLEEILMHSSNIGSAKLGLLLGDQRFYDYVRGYGFGQPTGVELPGEASGKVHPPSAWDPIMLTRMTMGQSVTVTPLQIVMGMSVIANGGLLMRPHLVHSITDDNGKEVVVEPEPIRQIVPKEVADFVKHALTEVVSERGTAVKARVEGFTVAGKTGTAQKVIDRRYAEGKYVVSFVGFMPAEDPEIVCLIMLDDAKVGSHMNYGGQIAAPVFSKVAAKVADRLNLVPTSNVEKILPVAMSRVSPEEDRP